MIVIEWFDYLCCFALSAVVFVCWQAAVYFVSMTTGKFLFNSNFARTYVVLLYIGVAISEAHLLALVAAAKNFLTWGFTVNLTKFGN